MNKLTLLFIFIILYGCGTGKLVFQSEPAAVNISVVESNGQIRKLGKTPIAANPRNIFFQDGVAKIIFSKEGYRDEVVYLPKPSVGSNLKISTQMHKTSSNANEIISNQTLEKFSSKLAEAQKFSFSKNYVRAKEILRSLINEYPNVSVPYDLLANVYYLSNDTGRALQYYEKANEINPGNSRRNYLLIKLRREKSQGNGQ